MAYKINDACISCGVCEPECPVNCISAGDDKYVIDAHVCKNVELATAYVLLMLLNLNNTLKKRKASAFLFLFKNQT